MSVMKIVVLCKPHEKRDDLESRIQLAVKTMHLEAEVIQSHDFRNYAHLSINPTRTPIVIINDRVEFAGEVPKFDLIKKRLGELRQFHSL